MLRVRIPRDKSAEPIRQKPNWKTTGSAPSTLRGSRRRHHKRHSSRRPRREKREIRSEDGHLDALRPRPLMPGAEPPRKMIISGGIGGRRRPPRQSPRGLATLRIAHGTAAIGRRSGLAWEVPLAGWGGADTEARSPRGSTPPAEIPVGTPAASSAGRESIEGDGNQRGPSVGVVPLTPVEFPAPGKAARGRRAIRLVPLFPHDRHIPGRSAEIPRGPPGRRPPDRDPGTSR